MAPHILTLGTIWRRVFRCSGLFLPGTHWIREWVCSSVSLDLVIKKIFLHTPRREN